MNNSIERGRWLVVAFLSLCCALALAFGIHDLLVMPKMGAILLGARAIFILFAGTAAWNIFHWKPAGRYLGFLVVLQWVPGILNFRPNPGAVTWVLTIPMIGVGIWLLLPQVKERFKAARVAA